MTRSFPTLGKRAGAITMVAAALVFVGAPLADARTGGSKSFGSRGSQTYSAPPSTRTAPTPAAPIERSITQPGKSTMAPTANAARPGMAQPSRWGGSFGGLLMGGLLGAGLFGLLSGAGLFSGLGSLAGMLGFMLQIGLLVGVAWLVMAFLRGRQTPAMAGAGGNPMGGGMARSGLGGPMDGGNAGAGGAGSVAGGGQLALQQADFESFERLLGRVQQAFSNENIAALRALSTEEVVTVLSEDIAANERQGLRNEISGVRLLSGDLAESWRERDAEYATVAIRFELVDTMVDRKTGRVVGGNANVPTEATEIWTFRRQTGSGQAGWRLSAIQQSA